MRRSAMMMALALSACAPRSDPPRPPHATPEASLERDAAPTIASSAPEPSATTAVDTGPPKPPRFTPDEALALLYPDGTTFDALGCAVQGDEAIRCAIQARYGDDKKGLATALAFFDEFGSIPGLETDHVMEGGFRGEIHLVPERPIGRYQQHFDWVLDAQRDMKRVFDAIGAKATHPVLYRSGPIGWKFLRSVGRMTPSAYAGDWRVGYNVSGSLNTSMVAVRDTMVHEIFHDNDAEQGNWSRKTIGDVFDTIVAKCGTRIACLTPYTPIKTLVIGGTYYSFQPNNGDACHEYAAELASRYFIEQRAAIRGEKLPEKPFKCGPPENATTWAAIVEKFFGGVDLSPACGG